MPLLFKMFISRLPPIHRPAFICEPEDTGTPYSSNHRDTIHATGHLVLLPLSVHPESLRSSTVQPSASRNHACPLSVKMMKLRCFARPCSFPVMSFVIAGFFNTRALHLLGHGVCRYELGNGAL